MLGRVVERSHPDAGTTRTAYAPNGLVLSSIYANGDRVSFDYRYGRLVRKSHSRLPQNDVEYTYDNAGRLASVKDGSGYQEFRYDQLGNVSKNIRTFAVPNSAHTYTFTMGFTYDSWGRTLSIVYPDDEEVSYGYDAGGGLRTVKGVKGSSRRTYVSDMRYDMYGNRTRVEYGNRAVADYQYDDLQRLQRLQCRALSGTSLVAMQDVSYSYDHVGNIVGIGNTAPRWTAAGMGGTYANTYAYDPLGRLSHARGDPSKQYDFGSLGMAYSPSGRIAAKALPFLRQSLVFGYCDIAQPHAPRRILNSAADTLTDLVWDPCGNLARTADYGVSGDGVPENVRHLFWAPENRLHTFLGAKLGGYYVYDHSGERTLKLGGTAAFMDINADILLSNAQFDDVTLYASPYLVATNKGYTKHYYAGTERLAARVGGGGIAGMSGAAAANFGPTFERKILDNAKKLLLACMDETSRHCAPNDNHCVSGIAEFDDGLLGVGLMPPPDLSKTSADVKTDLFKQAMHEAESENYPEPDVYFYHSDHLGSASWITDASGAPIQHLQYLPFGEQFVDEHTLAYQERFTFTGKERDSESGLYYFGARYHDSEVLTGWLSVDPETDKYPSITPYHYCHWKPVMHIDPNGEFDIQKHLATMWKERKNVQFLMRTGMMLGISWVADAPNYLGGRSNQSGVHMDNCDNYKKATDGYSKARNSFFTNYSDKKGIEAGVNLHTIMDFYSHSNYVECIEEYYKGNPDISIDKLPTFDEVLNDDKYSDLRSFLESNLKTGSYPDDHADPNGHTQMNKDNRSSVKGKSSSNLFAGHSLYSIASSLADRDVENTIKAVSPKE